MYFSFCFHLIEMLLGCFCFCTNFFFMFCVNKMHQICKNKIWYSYSITSKILRFIIEVFDRPRIQAAEEHMLWYNIWLHEFYFIFTFSVRQQCPSFMELVMRVEFVDVRCFLYGVSGWWEFRDIFWIQHCV